MQCSAMQFSAANCPMVYMSPIGQFTALSCIALRHKEAPDGGRQCSTVNHKYIIYLYF